VVFPTSTNGWQVTIPELDILPIRTTTFRPLGPIPHEESTYSGNLAVLENIFRTQYKLPDTSFEQAFHLIYGDQLTIQRLRTLKRRRRESEKPFDRLAWVLPIPALFHLKMNLLKLILQTHFGSQSTDQS
jgi:hypothetical protein